METGEQTMSEQTHRDAAIEAASPERCVKWLDANCEFLGLLKYSELLRTVNKVWDAGHNDDCLFCGFKDKAIKELRASSDRPDTRQADAEAKDWGSADDIEASH
jgi:hypothetical protein